MDLTIKNKIYQMFILGLEGEELNNNPDLINALYQGLGGVIFFTQNIKTKTQFKNLIKEIKNKSLITPFLSIDQEGGRVERTENIFNGKKYLSAKFAKEKGENFIKEQTEQISHLLNDFGINLNFAPCVDVNTNPKNPIIGERAFSDNPDEVIKFGNIVVNTYLKNNIIPCLKHFPGHGDTNKDSHVILPEINLTLDELKKNHIKPFKEIKSPMIMIAHLYCKAFDKELIPSSLSENVINYLRKNLNYQGLIITDDMVMGAIIDDKIINKINNETNFSANLAYKAISSGANILLYRNSFKQTIEIIEELAQKAQYDNVLLNNINTSFDKIIELKNQFFLFNT
jgi:beta-N-acetylhexosaminidase